MPFFASLRALSHDLHISHPGQPEQRAIRDLPDERLGSSGAVDDDLEEAVLAAREGTLPVRASLIQIIFRV